jgi:hypothetical protein
MMEIREVFSVLLFAARTSGPSATLVRLGSFVGPAISRDPRIVRFPLGFSGEEFVLDVAHWVPPLRGRPPRRPFVLDCSWAAAL